MKRDLTLFDAGDLTEVGEKGITLRYVHAAGSRLHTMAYLSVFTVVANGLGSRLHVQFTLLRIFFSSTTSVILSQHFVASAHSARYIDPGGARCAHLEVDCRQVPQRRTPSGTYHHTRRKSVLPVGFKGAVTDVFSDQTHNVAMVSPVADFVVDMGSNGRILSQGSLASALERDSKLLTEVKEERAEIEKAEQEIAPEKVEDAEAKPTVGKLVVAEEMEDGHVGW